MNNNPADNSFDNWFHNYNGRFKKKSGRDLSVNEKVMLHTAFLAGASLVFEHLSEGEFNAQ